MLFLFFFFQAEDGIRDLIVTGVQTCALPISFRQRSGAARCTAWISALLSWECRKFEPARIPGQVLLQHGMVPWGRTHFYRSPSPDCVGFCIRSTARLQSCPTTSCSVCRADRFDTFRLNSSPRVCALLV